MKYTVDTNVLVRALVGDEPAQARAAARALEQAELIAVTLTTLCELVWVLMKVYDFSRADVATAIRTLVAIPKVRVDPIGVESGLRMLEQGGDFADGVIAHQGRWLGGEVFLSFDRKAVALLRSGKEPAKVL